MSGVESEEFEARQRAREYFHELTVLPGAWTVVRVDGRSFSRFTEQHFDKPFDERLSELMVETARALIDELGGTYAYTQSDEISVLLPPDFEVFGRGVEKLVSISASIATATFTDAAEEPAQFDSRLWLGAGIDDVVDYFSWRQSDAARHALNNWCYWTFRKEGRSPREATAMLSGTSRSDKNELLFGRGINFNDTPTWQHRGIGLWWEPQVRKGFNPVLGLEVEAERRQLRIERELPMKDAYRDLVRELAGKSTKGKREVRDSASQA